MVRRSLQAPVAQRLERTAHNGLVAGSIPARRRKPPVFGKLPLKFSDAAIAEAEDSFAADGYLVLPGFFSAGLSDQVQEVVERVKGSGQDRMWIRST